MDNKSFESKIPRKLRGPILVGDINRSNLAQDKEVINDPRHESLSRAIKNINSKLARIKSESTNSVSAWEFIFDIREPEGLFEKLEQKGVSVIRNSDGTVTLKR